ncbi:hypothetical protein PHLGIDRAFT_164280 [Phlebiopsis gigantea 11061_1 CR5-6]|uniref:Ubiquitin 3 binding protein But2 C-terminal domain-containing protein n=1 Tax=Phlebiopsis gigantea (strain 11061_1 CR5-6) TaxID=745531 RepID=A0A0C3S8B5_PHLG1|nr:hypothetical protein PHLGIDRAFT_164280 [Phlebiopsis gigantea 11061_1 CR5-6]
MHTSTLFTAVALLCIAVNCSVAFDSTTLPSGCTSGQELMSKTVNVDGHEVLYQTIACSGQSADDTAGDPSSQRRGFAPDSVRFKRTTGECTTPAPECQCGAPVVCNCSFVTPGIQTPIPVDCGVLIDSLTVVAEVEGSTFFVETFTVMQLSYQTCVLTFTPLDTRVGILLEYCWNELAVGAGEATVKCFEGGSPSAQALCTPTVQTEGFNWEYSLLRSAP